MGREKKRERRQKERTNEKSERPRRWEKDPGKDRGRPRTHAVDATGAIGRGTGMALRIPIQAPLLLMGLLTTGEWDPGLVT